MKDYKYTTEPCSVGGANSCSGEIRNLVEHIAKSLAVLDESCFRLKERLDLCLAFDGPKENSKDCSEKSSSSPLGSALEEVITSIDRQTNRINEITERVRL